MSSIKHPKGLWTMIFIEIWERFSFYGMRYCFVLYMIKELFFSQQKASYIYGLYGTVIYASPLIGGYLVDRYISLRKAISIGSWSRFLGLILLSFGKESLFLPSLVCIIVATGFLRAGMNPLVGLLYDKNDDLKRDAGFRAFYVFANFGSFLSTLICGYVGAKYSYKYAFLLAGISIAIGQIGYALTANKTLGNIGLVPTLKRKIGENQPLTKIEKIRLLTLSFIVFVFITLYDICEEQAGNAITIFIEQSVDRYIGKFLIPTPWFQSLNPLIIVFFSPMIGRVLIYLSKKGKQITYIDNFAISLFLMSISYIILAVAGVNAKSQQIISMLYIVAIVFIQTIGEIFIYPNKSSLITKLSPKRYLSFVFGVMTLEIGLANFITGFLGGLYSKIDKSIFFLIFAFIAMIGVVLLMLLKKKVECINKYTR